MTVTQKGVIDIMKVVEIAIGIETERETAIGVGRKRGNATATATTTANDPRAAPAIVLVMTALTKLIATSQARALGRRLVRSLVIETVGIATEIETRTRTATEIVIETATATGTGTGTVIENATETAIKSGPETETAIAIAIKTGTEIGTGITVAAGTSAVETIAAVAMIARKRSIIPSKSIGMCRAAAIASRTKKSGRRSIDGERGVLRAKAGAGRTWLERDNSGALGVVDVAVLRGMFWSV
jgi:hypothetical protein